MGETFFIEFYEKELMKNYLICILIIFAINCGCTQTNTVAGVYVNEANTDQRISLSEMGTFGHSHHNYDNRTDTTRWGNYTVNNALITLAYSDGEISEFYVDGNELVQINGNTTDSPEKMLEKKYAKVIKM